MKKLVSFFAVAIVSAAMMFANGELNVRGFGQFVNFSDAKLVGNYESKVDLINFGLEVEGNLWFVHPWIMDIGLSTGYSFRCFFFSKILRILKLRYILQVNYF